MATDIHTTIATLSKPGSPAGAKEAQLARILSIIRGDDQARVPVGALLTVVDKSDLHLIEGVKLNLSGPPERRCVRATLADGTLILLHRLIMAPDRSMVVDHIDGDALNNSRVNLRVCTNGENMRNRHSACGTSRFKGVYRSKGRWCAAIRIDGRKIHLGLFVSETLAARAYDQAAPIYHGEFAHTNKDMGLYRKV
jgi:hypothetical protein